MIRDATATRARILEAATAEFAAHGLAGARVDRLATRAGANKERIYAYFGSKEGLFDATVEANIEQLLDAVPFTADDLPGYAEALFDFNLAHPEFTRLALWHMLERPGVMARLPQSAASTGPQDRGAGRAQRAGLVDDSLPPDQLVELVLGVVHSGLILPPWPTTPTTSPPGSEALRTAIATAGRRRRARPQIARAGRACRRYPAPTVAASDWWPAPRRPGSRQPTTTIARAGPSRSASGPAISDPTAMAPTLSWSYTPNTLAACSSGAAALQQGHGHDLGDQRGRPGHGHQADRQRNPGRHPDEAGRDGEHRHHREQHRSRFAVPRRTG